MKIRKYFWLLAALAAIVGLVLFYRSQNQPKLQAETATNTAAAAAVAVPANSASASSNAASDAPPTKEVGAAGLKYAPKALTGGLISINISLQDPNFGFSGGNAFGRTRPDHSGEFQRPVQTTTPFYFQLMKTGFQLQPKLTP